MQGEFIDEPLAVDDGAAVSYLHADMLGSVVRISSTGGAVSLTRQYDAWGNLEEGAGEPGYAFTGREWDPESGLYYYRARYYDPRIGRFVSEDPVGFRAGPNFYTYVSSNPVNLADPSGLLEVCCRATKYKFLGDKCHCFIVFDDGTTVGAYRVGTSLQKQLNHPDDKPKPPGTKCTKLPLGRCDELKILDLYFRYPDIEPYRPDNTSNTPPSYFLREIGWGGLPKCAQGQVPLQ